MIVNTEPDHADVHVDSPKTVPASPFDAVSHDLRELRLSKGGPSYAEIAMRITAHREARGVSPAAARIARSTVYDVFRTGRQRLNSELVAEIVRALGEDETACALWRQRCAEVHTRLSDGTLVTPPVNPTLQPAPQDLNVPASLLITKSLRFQAVFLAACIGLNLFGNAVIVKFDLPLFLDTGGTAAAALILGPWYGVIVAVGTGILATIAGSTHSLAFSLVAATAALIWGYGYSKLARARNLLGFLILSVAVAVAGSVVSATITSYLFDGAVTHATGRSILSLIENGTHIWSASFLANVPVSLADKVVSGYVALMILKFSRPLQLK